MRKIKFRAWNEVKQQIEHDVYKEYQNLMQYTGLKDKNGKEIYESDVTKREVFAFGEIKTFVGEVKMFEGAWWIDSGTAAVRLWNETHELEVIGNIYENPELLEAAE